VKKKLRFYIGSEIVLAFVALVFLSGCVAPIVFRENIIPIQADYHLALPVGDTVLTGIPTMLSDKMQVFDLVEIKNHDVKFHQRAYRIARLKLDKLIEPYYGGYIQARVQVSQDTLFAYMLQAKLLSQQEYELARTKTKENLKKIIKRRSYEVNRLIEESELSKWGSFEAIGFAGELQLEGYDAKNEIAIYSITGNTYQENLIEKQPVMIVWAKPGGEIKQIVLSVINRGLERR